MLIVPRDAFWRRGPGLPADLTRGALRPHLATAAALPHSKLAATPCPRSSTTRSADNGDLDAMAAENPGRQDLSDSPRQICSRATQRSA